ncbi:EAL domain-containing protein [Actinotalea sp. C106]|uniref:EAL domain-containing protein n=1 Tax=Actinotalea sp. C106 TaxID=2908644 RepID=UPI0020295077|nr:EAL domain-containing protein [Actinotalea sp. C106]
MTASGTTDELDTAEAAAFAALLDARAVQVAYQPLVELTTREQVGVEALARGPVGPLESPAALFAHAARAGRVTELDWTCRAAAFTGFLEAGAPPSMSLFINVEMASLTRGCPADLLGVVSHAESQLRVFVEFDDAGLASDPAGLLDSVDRAREMGWGVSVDDVGSSLGCLAVLPLVHADVVKLDIRMLDEDTDPASSVVATVLRHVEDAGATLVVKGIESEDDVRLALALGARFGQGHHLGRPGPLAEHYPVPRDVVPLGSGPGAEVPAGRTPFDLIAPRGRRLVHRELLRRLAHVFAARALSSGARPLVLVGHGTTSWEEVDGVEVEDLGLLAAMSVLTVAFGVGVPAAPVPGVRGVRLPSGDALVGESFLLIMTEHLALAMAARRAAGPGMVDVVITQDPEAVADVAQHLLRRIPPLGAGDEALAVPRTDGADGGVASDDELSDPEAEPAAQHEATASHRLSRLLGRRG